MRLMFEGSSYTSCSDFDKDRNSFTSCSST
jgi:hypothetical protein